MRLPFVIKLPIVVTFIVLVSLILLNGAWIYGVQDLLTQTAKNDINTGAQGTAQYANLYLQEKAARITSFARSQDLFVTDNKNLSAAMQNVLKQDREILDIQVLDNKGKELAHVSQNKVYKQNELVDQSNNPFVHSIPAHLSGAFFSDIVAGPHAQYLFIAVPVPQSKQAASNPIVIASGSAKMTTETSESAHTVLVQVAVGSLLEYLNSVRVGKQGYTFLTDKTGKIISHPDGTLLGQTGVLRGANTHTVIEIRNESGKQAYVRSQVLNNVNETLYIEEPAAALIEPIKQTGILVIVLSIASLLFALLVSSSITGQIVIAFRSLKQAIRMIGEGNLNYRLRNNNSEFTDLADTFNAMAANMENIFTVAKAKADTLSQEKSKITLTMDHLDDIVIVLDLEKRIIIFNKVAEETTGLTAAEVIGKPCIEALKLYTADNYGQYKELPFDTYCQIPQSGGESEGIYFSADNLKLVTSHGKEAFVTMVAKQMREGLQAKIGCVFILSNVNHAKQMDDIKLDFVSMAAHELRTPLTSIKGYLALLRMEVQKSLTEEQNKYLDRINISVDRLMALIENILNVSRIERGVLSVDTKPTDWQVLIEQIIDEVRDRAKEKNMTVVFHKPNPPLRKLSVDKFRIGQVVTNLITNAIKYTNPGGTIEIWTEQKENEVITNVKDNGRGIPQEAIPRMFTKFFRVTGSIDQGTKGTGLGLYIAKAIVEGHKGRIWVTSVPEEGSVFSFSIPVKPV